MKLNLGGGDTPIEGYLNVDRKTGNEAYPLFDVDGSVEEVRASHILEHFSHKETQAVLAEWVRVLKPGGWLKVSVPDFDKIIDAYRAGEAPVEGYLMGGHTSESDHHGAIFNEGKLRELLTLVGLRRIKRWKSEINDCAAYPISLNLMGRKPLEGEGELEGVQSILSMPRLCFTDQSVCLMESMTKLKIPTRIRQGVFWSQTLTAAIVECLKDSAKYILAIDYDTIFTADHVLELYRLMEDNPDADAIAPMQIGRDRDTVLMTVRGEDGKNKSVITREDADAELLQVRTCHFGLTMLRSSSFGKLVKPWLWHQPDKDGGWGDGRIDSDIYFWQNAEKSGWKVYQANQVKVGHLQMVISWPDKNLEPIHQYVNQYREHGPPEAT